MAILKCKMCGGELNIAEHATIATCEFCGTAQTLPKSTDSAVQNLFNRANDLRIKCEFDRAEQTYERILEQDNNDAEAHWGLLLSRYGIEYVDDPGTGRKIPTCHRASFEPITTDSDYLAAVELADPQQKELYVQEAKQIAEIQQNILRIAQSEDPFDVFLCYKETGEDGKRTVDSVIANDIYYQLTEEGYKVFYAPITLEDKLGSAYEPHIFAALNSAKVMLVIGTKAAHFDAVWVKNEWSRFLALMKKDRTKLLIPCYKDMDPYDLPDRFAHLQAQDMSKIGFINDIVRGIKKIISKAPETTGAPVKEATPPQPADATALLKRVAIFLSEQNWNSANAYCEKVLDMDPECAEAYLYKLMSDLHIPTTAQISHYAGLLASNMHYGNIIAFATPKMKEQVQQYEKSCRYNHAVKLLEKKSYADAKQFFLALADFKDSGAKAQFCTQCIAQEKLDAKQRLLAQKNQQLKKASTHYILSAVFLYIALFLSFLPFLMTALRIENDAGLPIFIGSIFLLIPVTVLYFVFVIKYMAARKKLNFIAPQHKRHITLQGIMLLVCAIGCLATPVLGHEAETWNFNFQTWLAETYFPITGAVLLMNCLLTDFKGFFAQKRLMIATVLLCSCTFSYCFASYQSPTDIIITACAAATGLTVLLFVLKKALPQRTRYHFSTVQLLISLTLPIALIVSCISLNNAAEAKQEALKKKLAGHVFVTTEEVGDYRTFTYIFDQDGKYTRVYRTHDYDTDTNIIETSPDSLGSYDLYVSYFSDNIKVLGRTPEYNASGEIVALEDFKRSELVSADAALEDILSILFPELPYAP